MCNHYRSDPEWRIRTGEFSDLKIRIRFPEAREGNQPPLEVYPGRSAPVVRTAADGTLEQVDMRWGLVPRSHKGPIGEFRIQGRKSPGLTNCRDPRDGKDGQVNWFCRYAYKERRCLIPAVGFYEYAPGEKGKRQEVIFTAPDEPVFFLAGLWEPVENAGEPVDTFTFMTTAPSELVAAYHEKAEPVILEPDEVDAWLDLAADPLPLIKASRPGRLVVSAAQLPA